MKKRERDDEFVLRDGSTSDEFKFREARAFRKERRELSSVNGGLIETEPSLSRRC